MENEKYKNLRTGIFFSGRRYFCALELALELIGGKWKPMMLYHLKNGPLRSSELQSRLNNISNKMFTQTARSLQHDGLIDLKLSRQMTFNVQYNWVANNTFSMSAYGQYYGEKNLYVPIFLPFNNGSAILKTYSSDQDYRRAKLGVSFSVKFFDGNLQLSAQPSITVFRYSGYYNMKKNPVAVNASATYYVGRFFMQAAYQTADRTIQGNLGAWYTTRDFYQLQAGWGNSNWNVRLSAINIFRGDYLAATQSVSAPLYSEKMQQCGTYYHRRVNLSVTYTFGYGKTLQHGNEVGEQTGGSSAILK